MLHQSHINVRTELLRCLARIRTMSIFDYLLPLLLSEHPAKLVGLIDRESNWT